MTFTIAVLNKKKDSYLLYFFEYAVKHINSNLAFCFLSFLSLFISFLSFFSLIILVTIPIHVTRLRYNPVLFYSKIVFPCFCQLQVIQELLGILCQLSAETSSEHCQISKMKFFAKMLNGF